MSRCREKAAVTAQMRLVRHSVNLFRCRNTGYRNRFDRIGGVKQRRRKTAFAAYRQCTRQVNATAFRTAVQAVNCFRSVTFAQLLPANFFPVKIGQKTERCRNKPVTAFINPDDKQMRNRRSGGHFSVINRYFGSGILLDIHFAVQFAKPEFKRQNGFKQFLPAADFREVAFGFAQFF